MHPFLKKEIVGIKYWEILFILGFYLFFAISYHTTLFLNRMGYNDPGDNPFSIRNFMENGGLGYLIKLILTIPLWWLMFKKMKDVPLKKRLLLHLVGLPVFVIAYQQIYYALTEFLGWGHLIGAGSVWDIYIPGLFYILQFGIFHAYNYYLENQLSLKVRSELREAATKSELAALKAQLNPHFLYNVFNTISASLPAEQEKTREMIAELSDLFRYQLKASKTEMVTLKEELNFVEKYLNLEKARFEDRLRIRIEVPEHLKSVKIPPMILQPLVENSVKHGISSKIEGGEIMIKVKEQGDKTYFIISDTGNGVKDKSTLFSNSGVGLSNTRERIEKIYGSKLKVSDNQPSGLKIEFAI
ncbi:MAG: histidine kinase [Saprospiraceae bacterium]|nr:histidine kinase [Saprospiraceae bacterium]